MAYVKNYGGNWQTGAGGGTPITEAALDNLETQYDEAMTEVPLTYEVGDLKAPTIPLAMNNQKVSGLLAPAVAGDALRKGTALTTTELPNLTSGKMWRGDGTNRPVEIYGAALIVAETEVFNGNSPGAAAWTDLDLSGTIGANVAIVMLKFMCSAVGGAGAVAFRKNGDADEHWHIATVANACGASLFKGAENVFFIVVVATDATGKVEWKCENVGVACTIDIVAYIK